MDGEGVHTHVIGGTGVGKSTYAENHAISNPHSWIFLDPHGQSAERLLETAKQVIYWDVGDTKNVVQFNPLHNISKGQHHVVAYIGRAVTDDQTPLLTFPNGLKPEEYVFGADRVQEGDEVRLVRDVLDVLIAAEHGDTAVCFLTQLIDASQWSILEGLQDSRGFKVFI